MVAPHSLSPERPWIALERPLVQGAIALVIVSVIIFASTGQGYVYGVMRGQEGPTFGRRLLWPAIWWYSWAALSPIVFYLVRRYPMTPSSWSRRLAIHGLGCVALFAVHVGIQVAAMLLPAYQHVHNTWGEAFTHHTMTSIYLNLFIYWSLVGIAHGVRYYEHSQRQAVRTIQLESALAKAQVQALKMQLQPHFLFNTLHSISTLMYRNVEDADRMLVALSDLLRATLDQRDYQEVPLRDELDLLQRYLSIEAIRFKDRLRVSYEVEADNEEALVPTLILQPLVENAIKHGVAPHSEAIHIRVQVWREQETLCIAVIDDGPGIRDTTPQTGNGVGLANTRARLHYLYGEEDALRLEPVSPQGLSVTLRIPIHTRPVVLTG